MCVFVENDFFPSRQLKLQYFAFIELKHTSRTILGVQRHKLCQTFYMMDSKDI